MAQNNKCTTCQKVFKNKTALKSHERVLHSGMTNVYVCPICNKTMKYLKNFSKHYMDAHKATLEDAKTVEKTLVAQKPSSKTDAIDSKCLLIYLIHICVCVCVYTWSLQLDSV